MKKGIKLDLKPSFEAVERAKAEGLLIVTFAIDGRHAKTESFSSCGPCDPKYLSDLFAIFHDQLRPMTLGRAAVKVPNGEAEAEEPAKPREGWGAPVNSNRSHYFVSAMALCGKMLYGGPLRADDGDERHGECAGCRKKFNAKKAKESPKVQA